MARKIKDLFGKTGEIQASEALLAEKEEMIMVAKVFCVSAAEVLRQTSLDAPKPSAAVELDHLAPQDKVRLKNKKT